ncbi:MULTISPECIES: protein-glutamine glutaminase family protein [unclassified Microcoleus]|uniref:protein-glutamine glutaminase family protein n=1 Tax=unclassified Microcoleus TaxID=2642155 RepID=UPI002FD159FD
MSNTRAIAGLVSHIDLPPLMTAAHRLSFESTPVDVTFESGETTYLDATNPLSAGYAEILEDLRHAKIPGYVEVDPQTRSISRLLIPIQAKVVALVKIGGDVAVGLEISQSHRVLKSSNSQFARLLSILEEAKKTGATVLVTDTDDREIIDVRPWETVTTAQELTALDLAAEALSAESIKFEELATEGAASATVSASGLPAVSWLRLNQLFNWLASGSCNPITVPPPCIPFLYPDDGCWGRAHSMARRIVSVGNVPGKVWNYGNLRANTRNNPNCYVRWGWHVAPIMTVIGSPFYWVIDPSMFGAPVTVSQWKQAQSDPGSQIVYTVWQVFHRSQSGQVTYDPNFTQTAQVLATYRAALRVRSLTIGAPPYAKCH